MMSMKPPMSSFAMDAHARKRPSWAARDKIEEWLGERKDVEDSPRYGLWTWWNYGEMTNVRYSVSLRLDDARAMQSYQYLIVIKCLVEITWRRSRFNHRRKLSNLVTLKYRDRAISFAAATIYFDCPSRKTISNLGLINVWLVYQICVWYKKHKNTWHTYDF